MYSLEEVLIFVWNKYVLLNVGLLVCLYISCRFITKNNDYFAKRNVAFVKPTFLFGNFLPVFRKKASVSEHVKHIYMQLDGHRIGGMFQFTKPLYMVRDPELIKHVTVKDFDHFIDIPVMIPDDSEPLLTKSLQALRGQKWKEMRATLSPAFTSSKLKIIFKLISEISNQMVSYLEKCYQEQQTSAKQDPTSNVAADSTDMISLDVKELFTKYTNDVIATSAFGVHCNSLENPDNEFYKMGKEFNSMQSFWRFIVVITYTFFPRLMKAIGVTLIPKKITDFFRSLIKETIRVRQQEGIMRPDMIHLLMQVRKDGLLEDEDSDGQQPDIGESVTQENDKTTNMRLDIDDIAAQALVFFTAGFEVVSQLLSFSTLLLAAHQDVQERARKEVDDFLAAHEGHITYEAVQKMKLVDNIMSETLRLYPPAPFISRKCVKTYKVPETELTVEAGSIVTVPCWGLHHDPQHFPDPETFNPDRFSDENKHNIKQFTYIPFGIGPRQCIANRFALMETKAALVHLLRHFEVLPSPKTKLPIKLQKHFTLTVEGGFWVGFKPRSVVSHA